MNKKILLFLSLIPTILTGQILKTIPAFPKATDEVTIIFDATKGTGGLKDCNCDVYVHTGVITSASTSPSDWKHVVTTWGVANPKWKMTRVAGEKNLYSYKISPSINKYYNVGTNEEVKKMAFVFRNANGSKEGKDTGGKDIFAKVYTGDTTFNITLLQPSQKDILIEKNNTLNLKAIVSDSAFISLYIDSILQYKTEGINLNYDFIVNNTGTHHANIIAISKNNEDTATVDFYYTVPDKNTIESIPDGFDDGINILNDSTALLILYAPAKKHVFAIGDFNDWRLNTFYQLKNTPDGKRWWLKITGLKPDKKYGFQYLIDGKIKIGDPYSETVLDPWHDRYITEDVFEDLKPYPAGKTEGIVSVFATTKKNFQWDNFDKPNKENLVIYELLIRDFLKEHSYRMLEDTLDYLKKLGINAIELMPVNEFEGNISWGYNPSYHYALDKYYGDPLSFKHFVNTAHNKGIAVILDVVFNHAFGQCPLVQMYWDDNKQRPAADNPWFNPVPRHPFNVGYDFNHESQATKYYVQRNLRHWLEEYDIDGFRFDLSKGFTQKYSTNNSQMSAYDPSRIKILKSYADYIWTIEKNTYVILEHFADNKEENELSDYGMMLWGNMNYQYNEATMGYGSDLSGVLHIKRNWSKAHLVGYMESHDEERLMYKNLRWGNKFGSYNVKNLNTALSRMQLAGTFYFLLPGPKMIWQFGELGYDYSINTCEDGSINDNCRLSPKPIRWDYYEVKERKQLYDYWAQLIYLKTHNTIFNTGNIKYNLNNYIKSVHFSSADTNIVVIGNFDVRKGNANPDFQHTGRWYDLFAGDSIDVTNTSQNIQLDPGEYHIYSDKKLYAKITNSLNVLTDQKTVITIYPNPARQFIFINISDNNNYGKLKIDILNIKGKIIYTQKANILPKQNNYMIKLKNLNAGIYILRLQQENNIYSKKIIVLP